MSQRVVVVGAGPAGLVAATQAASAGASVLLLDEQSAPGGHLRHRVQSVAAAPGTNAERPWHFVKRMVDDAIAAGVELRTDAVVAGCFANNELLVVAGGRATRIQSNAIVVATGSTDLPYPFSGSTYPGVFSGRGLQILLNTYRILPGRRFAIVGNGADAEELAVDIMLAGGEVVWSGITPPPFLRAAGPRGVQSLLVGQDEHAIDVIAITVGRQPDPTLATMAGTPLAFSEELGGLIPLIDDYLRSPIAGLFVAGDAAGIGSVAAAISEGRLAGTMAASIGPATGGEVEKVRADGGPELASRVATRASLQPVAVQPYE